ncbi:unnamed protein product [Clavelina lepadiformis]|uniref:Uncharacterized protein n=1 Tax=Clavelina lepadiformis TaxID=159417 RepID=A0ABP0GMH9_CLALP
MSIYRVQQPTANFLATEQFNTILGHAQENSCCILHCHGFPGTGKSQILLKLAELFPYTKQKKPSVKWSMHLDDSGTNLKVQFKMLLDRMHQLAIISTGADYYQEIVESIDENASRPFLDALHSSKIPILILIECKVKLSSEQKRFLKDFLLAVGNDSMSNGQGKVHIYIASHRKSDIFEHQEYSHIPCYKMELVKGFEINEGVRFLLDQEDNSNEEIKNAANELSQKFSGSPLRLQLAKSYCRRKIIDYADYLHILSVEFDHGPMDIPDDPVKDITTGVLEAITLLYPINRRSEKDAVLAWKVLSCLSYLHHDCIPKFVVERFCQELRDDAGRFSTNRDVEVFNKLEAGNIIRSLLDQGLCNQNDENEITFHNIVMQAIHREQMNRPGEEDFDPLKEAACIIAGFVTGDYRVQSVKSNMCKLLPHGKVLLQNLEIKKDKYNGAEALMMSMIMSHLYEIFGSIWLAPSDRSFHKSTCDTYFKRAIIQIWTHKDAQYSLTSDSYTGSLAVDEIANFVVDECEEEAISLPADFVQKYEACVLIPDDAKLNFLKDKLSQNTQQFVKNCLTSLTANFQLVAKLRDDSVFLSESKHRKIFFAERLASILHSWSLVYIYTDEHTLESWKQYNWRSEMATAICRKCREKHGVRLLTEHITTTSWSIPSTLKAKKKSCQDLLRLKEMCEKQLDKKCEEHYLDMYNHGLLSEFYGPWKIYKQISMQTFLVRIYARILGGQEKDQQIKQLADKQCSDLVKMTKEKLSQLSYAPARLIYCAKYYAATKQFPEALECYKLYFDAANTDDQTPKDPWAVCNYARTVYHGKISSKKDDAIKQCENVLNSNVIFPGILHAKLKDVLKKLNENFTLEST